MAINFCILYIFPILGLPSGIISTSSGRTDSFSKKTKENNMIKYVLFDLDGTLLPMDLDEFFRNYFKLLASKLYPYGYTDSKKLIKVVVGGVDAATENDGTKYNGEVFWNFFDSNFPDVKAENKIESD